MRGIAICRSLLCITVLLLFAKHSASETYVVAPDGSGDYPTIQAAVDASVAGDIIELLPGTFRGEGNRDVEVYTQFEIRSQQGDPSACIIDCEGTEQEPHNGFRFYYYGTLEGVSIINGHFIYGGAVYVCCSAVDTSYLNCVFAHNTAFGGGAICAQGLVFMTNCTFYANRADHGAHIMAYDWGWSIPQNCIFACGELDTPFYSADYVEDMVCCNVFGNEGGDYVGPLAQFENVEGNISLDPLFCNPEGDNLFLCVGSPCAPFTPPNEECDLIGALGIGCGSTAIESTTWGRLKAFFRE